MIISGCLMALLLVMSIKGGISEQEAVYVQALGTVIYDTEPILPISNKWLHILEIVIPCPNGKVVPLINDMLDEAINSVGDTTLSIMSSLETLNKTDPNNPLLNITLDILNNIASVSESVQKTLRSDLDMLQDIIEHGSKLWGGLNVSMCARSNIIIDKENSIMRRSRSTNMVFHGESKPIVSINHGKADPDNNNIIDIEGQSLKPSVHLFATLPSSTTPKPKSNIILGENYHIPKGHIMIARKDIQKPQGSPAYSNFSPSMDINISDYLQDSESVHSSHTYSVRNYECFFIREKQHKCTITQVKEIGAHDAVKYLTSNRKRRGLLPFIGSAHSWLFGTATQADLKVISGAINNLQSQITSTRQFVTTTNKNMVSLSAELNNKINNLIQKFNTGTTYMQSMFRNLKGTIKQMQGIAQVTLTYVENLALCQSVMAQLQAIHASEVNLRIYIQDIHDQLKILESSVKRQSLGYDLLEKHTLLTIIEDTKNSIGNNLDIAVDPSFISWYQSPISNILLDEGKLYITIQIPIIPKVDSIKTSLIRTLPYSKQGYWLEFPYNNVVIVIMKNTLQWALLDYSQYLSCYQNPFHICNIPVALHAVEHGDCIYNLIRNPNVVPGNCKLLLKKHLSRPDSQALAVTSNKWLLCLPNGRSLASLSCEDDDNTQVTKTFNIEDQMLVTIPPGCTMLGAGLQLSAKSILYSQKKTQLYLNHSIHSPHIGSTKRNITTVSNKQYLTLFPDVKELDDNFWDDTVFKQSSIKIEHLLQDNSKSKVQYMTKMDKLAYEFKKINESLLAVEDWSLIKIPSSISNIIQIVSLGLSGIAFVISILVCIRSRNYAAQAAFPMMKLPGSWAAYITKLEEKTNISTSDAMIPHAHLDVIIGYLRMYHWLSILWGALFLCLMICCAFYTSRVVKRFIRIYLHRALIRMGYYPLNKGVRHNLGENQLIAFFIIEVTGWPSQYNQAVEIGVQICTLPSKYDEWFLSQPIDVHGWIPIEGQCIKRNTLIAKLVWSPKTVCIKSKVHELVETCEEMPKMVEINLDDIRKLGSFPHYYWLQKCVVKGTTRLMVINHGMFEDIYNYDNYND